MNAATTVTRKIASCRRQAARVRAAVLGVVESARACAPWRAAAGLVESWPVAPRWAVSPLAVRCPCPHGSARPRFRSWVLSPGLTPPPILSKKKLLRIVRCPQARKGTRLQPASASARSASKRTAREVLSSRDLLPTPIMDCNESIEQTLHGGGLVGPHRGPRPTDRPIKTISWACVGRRGQWLNRSEQSRGKTQPDRTADRLLRSGPGARRTSPGSHDCTGEGRKIAAGT